MAGIFLFCYIHHAAGIGPHMAADGSANIDDLLVGNIITHGAEFFRKQHTVGTVAGIHGIEIMIGAGFPVFDPLAQPVHTLAHSHGLGRHLNGTLFRHPDDGFYLCQGTKFIHRLADPASTVKVFQRL